MSLFAKIMVFVNLLLAAGFLAAAGTLLSASEDWKAKYVERDKKALEMEVNLNNQIKADIDKIATVNSQIASKDKELATAIAVTRTQEDQKSQLQKAHDNLMAELAKLADAQRDLQAKLADLNGQIDRTRAELATATTDNGQLKDKVKSQLEQIAQLEQAKDNAEKSMMELEKAKKMVDTQLDDSQTQLAAYKRMYPVLPGAATMQAVKGVVQAADNKVDVYILSLGSKDKIAVGYELTVYRGSEYVTRIVVDKVWDNYSSAHSVTNTKRKDVQPGDEFTNNL